MWRFAALHSLSVLCFLHFGLLGASQPQHNPSATDAIQVAIVAGKSQKDAGHFSEAIREFTRALGLARERRDLAQTAECLNLLSVSYSQLFDYRAGLTFAQQAHDVALQVHDNARAGAASTTIATIYGQLGDFSSAEREASRAVDELRRSSNQDSRAQRNLVRALVNHALLCFLNGNPTRGEASSRAGIELASKLGSAALEATAWEVRSTVFLRKNDVGPAETALRKEYSLRESSHDERLALTKEHLAELEIKKLHPDYTAALKLIDEAFAAPSPSFKASAQYYPIHVRGEILLKSGKKAAALSEFRRAVNSAGQWRRGALPGDITSRQTVASLHDTYADFAMLAAEMSLEKHDSALLREGLEVLAENRAASLREQLTSALGRDFRLPESYFEKLTELQSAQAHVTLGRNTDEDRQRLVRIQAELGELENQIGLKSDKKFLQYEKNFHRNSLRDIQNRLSGTQVLLSFSLGKEKSFLWAVSGTEVSVYPLDRESSIAAKAKQFTAAVRTGHALPDTGRDLAQTLFGQLPKHFAEKSEWLIVGDGALLNGVPFSALPNMTANHILRFLPSELLLLVPDAKRPAPSFLGVADPIYNFADSRLSRSANTGPNEDSATISLARLVGSEREVRTAALLSGMSDEQLLVGTRATIKNLHERLANAPALVHFAVHVVSPPDQPQEAALALSLKNGMPELLTSQTIATYHLPGSLIVMSGCFSEQGKALPSTGLVGLSRAWLLAGAAAVLVSAWPTPDDSGRFFSAFYRRFQLTPAVPLANRAAIALQQAQLDMQRNKDYSSLPSFWAAYSIVSRE